MALKDILKTPGHESCALELVKYCDSIRMDFSDIELLAIYEQQEFMREPEESRQISKHILEQLGDKAEAQSATVAEVGVIIFTLNENLKKQVNHASSLFIKKAERIAKTYSTELSVNNVRNEPLEVCLNFKFSTK